MSGTNKNRGLQTAVESQLNVGVMGAIIMCDGPHTTSPDRWVAVRRQLSNAFIFSFLFYLNCTLPFTYLLPILLLFTLGLNIETN